MKSHQSEVKPSASYSASLFHYIAATHVGRTISLVLNFAQTNSPAMIGNDKSNCILPGLFLGMIPVKGSICGEKCTNSHRRIIKEVYDADNSRPLGLVLSVVLKDEQKGHGFWGFKMTQVEDWQEYGVKHELLEIGDREVNVNHKSAVDKVFSIKQCIEEGKSVYVHCKAGRQRSAMICAIYIAAFVKNPVTEKLFTINEAILFLQKKRSQVGLLDTQIIKAHEILTEVLNDVRYPRMDEKKPGLVKK